eukprot:2520312-Karenia_brevis.AAC.1
MGWEPAILDSRLVAAGLVQASGWEPAVLDSKPLASGARLAQASLGKWEPAILDSKLSAAGLG